jgi:hypothetical protein
MKKLFSSILTASCLASTLSLSNVSLAQSTEESNPTPVSGNSIRATLVDNVESGYTAYYYSMRLNAGNYRSLLKVKLKECLGQQISVYVDGDPNVFPSNCNNNIATGELDFVVKQTKNVLVTIYVSGADRENFDLDLSFQGKNAATNSNGRPKGKTCTYTDRFSLSDTRPKYEKIYPGLVFKKGTAQMFITTINNEGTNISGTVYAEQTDAGTYNTNLVLPADGFGGTIGTPLNNAPVRDVQSISGKGKGRIRILFEQNGNGSAKTGSYKLVVTGDAIVNCGSGVAR